LSTVSLFPPRADEEDQDQVREEDADEYADGEEEHYSSFSHWRMNSSHSSRSSGSRHASDFAFRLPTHTDRIAPVRPGLLQSTLTAKMLVASSTNSTSPPL
jgi:hypothetical protein